MRGNGARGRRAVLVVCAIALVASGCDWTQFRGSSTRTGAQSEALAEFAGLGGIVEKWSAEANGAERSSPSVVGGVVYVGADDGTFTAYDAQTGTEKFTKTTGGAVAASPAIDGGVAFIGSADKKLYAYDAVSGAPKWSKVIDASFGGDEASPAIVGDNVFVSSANAVYAVKTSDGAPVWSKPVTGPLSPPAVAG